MSSFVRRAGPATLVMILAGSCGGPRVLPPDVRVNPSPKERFEITLTMQEPPALPRRIDGQVQFFIENEDCVPLADSIAGFRPNFSYVKKITFEQDSPSTYVADIYADWPIAEDFYGLGTCNWKISSVKAFVHPGRTTQSTYLDGDRLVSERSRVNVCPRSNKEKALGECKGLIEEEVSERREKEFIVTLRSRRILQ